MARRGSQVHHMGDRGLSMGESWCKGALAGTSAGRWSYKREVVRDGMGGYKGGCMEGWSGKGRSIRANRNLEDT